jgi:cell division protein FtsW
VSATAPRPLAARATPTTRERIAARQPAKGQVNQLWLGALVGVLTVIGLVMVLSASTVQSLSQYGSPWAIFERQVLWVLVGSMLAAVAWRSDYRAWRRLGSPAVVGCAALLLAVLIPGLGQTVAGSSRWLGHGTFRVQPSELTKLALVIFGADVLARRSGQGQRWGPAVRPVLIALVLTAGLVFLQPDMGTALILGCITLGLLYAAGIPGKLLGATVGASALIAFVLGVAEPYRRVRLLSFLNPWTHRATSGYQVVQSLVGFANGHVLGVGLGASQAKWGYLPNAYTDFIFTIVGDEMGLIGSLLVVALFGALAVFGLRIAARAPDRFGALLACAITCWLLAQAIFNIGAVIGLLPVTGVPLPFVSYGGSSLVIEMLAVGLLGSIARRSGRGSLGQ